MKMYGLRHRKFGNMMGFSYSSNGDCDSANSTSCNLCVAPHVAYQNAPFWLVHDKTIAETAAESTEWFNSGYESPTNDYAGQLEVVEFELTETKQ